MTVKSLALLIGILCLLSLVGYWVYGQNPLPAAAYAPSDVVYGQTLHVTHQIEAATSTEASTGVEMVSSVSPRLEVPRTFYDFGQVSSTQVVTRVFEIANRGTAPLVITAAHTTCACTTAELTAAQVPPGKLVLVTVRFDPSLHDLSGQTVRRGVILETNDPQNPSVDFWVQATVR